MTDKLVLPIPSHEPLSLTVGTRVLISGVIFSARHGVHQLIHDGGMVPFEARGSLVYHCGPAAQKKKNKRWQVLSAAPDASLPHEPYLMTMLARLGIRGFLGHGGLSSGALGLLRRSSACYFQTVGDGGLALARRVKEVRAVHLAKEFSGPDAVWELEVEDLPAVVTMDTYGQSLHDLVRDVSHRRLAGIHD